jgi:tetratricopeptide (TPR) repeat protein
MTDGEKRYQTAIMEGHSAAWDQNWLQAAEFYRQALVEKPEDPRAHTNLALALFELGNFKDSLTHYMLVAEKTPQDPVPIEKIAILYEVLNRPDIGSRVALKAAEIYLNNGDIDKAMENWIRATEMNPGNITALSRQAIVYQRNSQIPQAVKTYLQIASILQHSDRVEKAVQVINQALRISPDDDDATRALKTIHEGKLLPTFTKRMPEIDSLGTRETKFLEEPKKKPIDELPPIQEAEKQAVSDLATLFFEQTMDEDKAKKSTAGGLQQIINGTSSVNPQDYDTYKLRLHLGQVVDLLSRGEQNQADDDLNRLIEIGLHHPAVYYQLGVIRYNNDRLESAIRFLRRSVNHSDYALASRLLIANALEKQGHINKSSLECLEALKIADSQVVPIDQAQDLRHLYAPLIEAHAQKLDEVESEGIFNTIFDLLDHPGWRQNLRKVREELIGESEYLMPIAEALTSVTSSQVVIAISGIRKLAEEGRRHAAFEEACFTLQEAPTYLPLHITIGDILLAGNQVEAALEKFKVVSRSYNVRGESGRAIDVLRRVIELSPLDLDAHHNLLDQLKFRGQHEDVIEELIKIAEIHYNLAELADARETYSTGLRYINQVKLGNPWRLKILHKIADIDVQSLNWRQGLEIYDRICEIDPDDVSAHRKRINLKFRMGDRRQALNAIESFTKKMKMKNRSDDLVNFLKELNEDWPKEVLIIDLLADEYQDLRRTKEAIAQYDRNLKVLLENGDKEEAVVIIHKIMNLRPENLNRYTELLERIID